MHRSRVVFTALVLLLPLIPSVLIAGARPVAAAQASIAPSALQGSGSTFFLISSVGTDMCADVSGASQAPATPVIVYSCNFNPNEQFVWMADGTIRAFNGANLCLDDSGAQGNSGDAIVSYPCDGGANEKWTAASNGSIQGINGKCIDIYHANVANGTPLILWPCTGAANQVWITPTTSAPTTVTSTPPAPTGIPLSPGANIQSVVNANPAGTAFVLNAGTYYGQSVIPKSGDTFQGQPGAVLDGQNSAPYAFSKGSPPYPSNVTIRGLKVTNYAPPTQYAAIDAGGFNSTQLTSGWVIDDNEVSYNGEYGIRAGNTTQITNNNVHHNKRLDITATAATNVLVANNEIAFGNYGNFFSVNVEAGGTKFVGTTGLTLENNYVHDNIGGALWLDLNNINTLIEGNTVANNSDDGISTEISYAATIRDNTVTGNGWKDPLNRYSFLWNAGIAVHASSNVEIYGNTVSGNFAGIVAVQQNRSADPAMYGPHLVQNLYVHDNTITQTDAPSGIYQTSAAAGIAQDTGDNSVFTSWNNRFVNNTYYLGSNPWPFAWMNVYQPQASWQSYGQDVGGIFNY